MPTQNSQLQHPPMTADSAKAALGVSTRLANMLMPKGQAPQTPNTAPQPPSNQQNETDINSQIQGLEGRIMDEIGTLRQEIHKVGQPKDQNAEIQDLKQQIEKVLAQPDDQA